MNKNVKLKTTVIFDFDFTITSNIELYEEIYNEAAKKYATKKITNENRQKLKDSEPKKVFKLLGLNFWKLFLVANYMRKKIDERQSEIKIYKGIKNILKKLDSENYILGILSSHDKKSIKQILHREEIEVFDFIYSKKKLLGKASIIKKIIRKQNLQNSLVIYVGDEIRDIQAMREVKIPIISVSWGLSSPESLKKYNLDLVVNKPEKILDKIKYLEDLL